MSSYSTWLCALMIPDQGWPPPMFDVHQHMRSVRCAR